MFIYATIDNGKRAHIFGTTARGEVCFRSLCKRTGKDFFSTEANGFNVCIPCKRKLDKLRAGK